MPQGLNKGATLQNGTYRIEEVLGQGTFGITYLATMKEKVKGRLGMMEVDVKVAIKEFFMSVFNHREPNGRFVSGTTGKDFTKYRKQFRREAENLSHLSHQNIVQVFDVFDEYNTTYYAMRYIDGKSLDKYISSKGRLTEDEAIAITLEIGKPLEYMHSRKMLHLDIKPSNVMRGQDGRHYLIDFGLAKQFSEDGYLNDTTSIGRGTPGYAPIEQEKFKHDGTFPATLDVYALGATMFKMLTGETPPASSAILNEGFPTEELLKLGVSTYTINTLVRAMRPVVKQRFQSIDEFLSYLKPEAEINSETSQLQEMERKILLLTKEMKKKDEILEKYLNKLNILECQKNELNSRIAEKEEVIATQLQNIKSLEERLHEEYVEKKKSLEQTKRHEESLIKASEKLQDELEYHKEKSKDLISLYEKESALLHEAHKEIDFLKHECMQTKKEKSDLKSQNYLLKNEINKLYNKCQTLERKIDNVK